MAVNVSSISPAYLGPSQVFVVEFFCFKDNNFWSKYIQKKAPLFKFDG